MNKEVAKSKNALEKLLVDKDYDWDQIIVGFSGGKDSTATLQLLIDVCIESNINIPIVVLSSNTLIENPLIEQQLIETREQILKIAQVNNLNISHLILEPDINSTFFVNTIGKGYSTPLSTMGRWCTRSLKVDPMEKYYKNIEKKTLVLSGVREAESSLRKKNINSCFKSEVQRDNKYIYKYAPIKNWKLNDIWDYIMDFLRGNENYYINNNTLWEIYRDGTTDDICPSSLDMSISKEHTKSCGKSRYGCYMCPLVLRDKALEANVQNGREELIPYLELRNWYMKRCFDPRYRQRQNRRKTVKLKKVDIKKNTYKYKLLNTVFKGSLTDKNVVIKAVPETKEELIAIVEANTKKIQEEGMVLFFLESKDGVTNYKIPITGQLSVKFRVEFYQKVLELEEKYNIQILKKEERIIIEDIFEKENIKWN